MGAVAVCAGAALRRRWVPWLALALVIGAYAGGVTAVAAGARRTDTAYPRLLAATAAPDLLLVDDLGDPSFARFSPRQVAHLPHVTEAGVVRAYTVLRPTDAGVLAPVDGTVGTRFERRKVLAGRLPNPRRADEVAISFTVAADHHLRPGATFRIDLLSSSGSTSVPVALHVVGIEASASEFPPQTGTSGGTVWATPAFNRVHGEALAVESVSTLRVAGGAGGVPAVQAEIDRLAHGKPTQGFAFDAQGQETQRSIRLSAIALWALAGLLALVGVLVMAQLLARQSALESAGTRELRSLGMTTRQVWAVGMGRVVFVGAVAGATSLVVAVAASPLFPIGLAAIAEPHPGLSFDGAVLALGVLVTVIGIVACGAWPAWRTAGAAGAGADVRASASSAAAGAARVGMAGSAGSMASPSRPVGIAGLVGRLSGTGAPVTATTGITFAVDRGRGLGSIPLRSTLAAAVVGVAALTGSIVFSSSLTNLLDSPSLYGVTYSAGSGSLRGEGASLSPALAVIHRDRAVDAVSVGYTGVPMKVDGVSVGGVALAADRGPLLQPTLVQGRSPVADDEIVLGTTDLQRLHLHLGDTVRITVAGIPVAHPVRVVGTAIFPDFGDQLSLGQGAQTTIGVLKSAVGSNTPPPDTILMRFRPGTDVEAAITALQGRFDPASGLNVMAAEQPVDLINFGRVQNLPLVVGGLLGLLAAGTLVHLLLTSIRRRRRDLAVLKVLGFVPGQLRATIAWQASTITALALVIGLPLGIVLGRSIWRLFAHQIGVIAVPVVSPPALAALAVAAFVVSALAALVPARAASRTPASEILRTA